MVQADVRCSARPYFHIIEGLDSTSNIKNILNYVPAVVEKTKVAYVAEMKMVIQ